MLQLSCLPVRLKDFSRLADLADKHGMVPPASRGIARHLHFSADKADPSCWVVASSERVVKEPPDHSRRALRAWPRHESHEACVHVHVGEFFGVCIRLRLNRQHDLHPKA